MLPNHSINSLRREKSGDGLRKNKGHLKNSNASYHHSNNPRNDGADKKASEGAHNKNADNIKLEVPKEYRLQGARLSAMTQKLAYDWITQLKGLKPITKKGKENQKDTMDALEESGSPSPTEQKL